MFEIFIFALLLSLFAGLSTAFGGIIALFFKNPGPKYISAIMGFSAGVMLFISFTELLQEGIETFNLLIGSLYFFLGMGIMFIIDMTLSHKYHFEESFFKKECKPDDPRLQKASIFIFLGIFIHNFPEGVVTLVATLENIEIGVILAIAIALHNIPEGIAVAVPICVSVQDKKKGFFWAFLSGMSEPIGAFIFGLFFLNFLNEVILAALLALVGGIMVYVSIDELLPISQCSGNESISIIGIVSGMFIMALSLSLL